MMSTVSGCSAMSAFILCILLSQSSIACTCVSLSKVSKRRQMFGCLEKVKKCRARAAKNWTWHVTFDGNSLEGYQNGSKIDANRNSKISSVVSFHLTGHLTDQRPFLNGGFRLHLCTHAPTTPEPTHDVDFFPHLDLWRKYVPTRQHAPHFCIQTVSIKTSERWLLQLWLCKSSCCVNAFGVAAGSCHSD